MERARRDMSKTIKEFNRANVRQVIAECEEAVRAVAEKYGLTLERQGRTFYRDHLPVKFQLHAHQTDAEGNKVDPRAKDFARYARYAGLPEDAFGQEFTNAGRTYRITGWNTRAKRYPVMGEDVRTGKTYKFPVDTVRRALQDRAA